ncbi:MAG: NAD-dependent epimerase/dehydratase family protein [Chloroflexota bacterium]|nr:NAD-dependent epimerase/dehydratase family protein [Chloroflexota bacterium]
MTNTYLVTGAMGCLGAWTIHNLVAHAERVIGLDLSTDPFRLKLLMSDAEIEGVQLLQGDITDYNSVERIVLEQGVTHVIHLAALQVPFCKANPVLGSQVNVVGTVNVFEAAARHPDIVQRVVYTSSAAVYGPSSLYGSGAVREDAPLAPATHYGVYKQANEGTARIYAQDSGVTSIGVRPYVIYGLGRDRGVTSSPTKAMLSAALGKSFPITYGGRCNFQWADDVAKTLIALANVPFTGARVVNLGGSRVSVREVAEAIEAAARILPERILYPDTPLPFPDELDDTGLKELLPDAPETPLSEGVRATIEAFRDLVALSRIDVENALA